MTNQADICAFLNSMDAQLQHHTASLAHIVQTRKISPREMKACRNEAHLHVGKKDERNVDRYQQDLAEFYQNCLSNKGIQPPVSPWKFW